MTAESPSVMRRDLMAILLTPIGGISAGTLFLSSGPAIVADSGGSTTLAGAVAALFMCTTVVAQLMSIYLLRALGFAATMVMGVLLLSLPCVIGLLEVQPEYWLLIAALRGAGFGILTVVSAALPPLLTPAPQLGRVTGVQGLAFAASQLLALPGGMLVLEQNGTSMLLIVGILIPTIALAAYPALRRIGTFGGAGLSLSLLPARGARIPLVIACTTLAGGAAAFGTATTLIPVGPYASASLVLFVLSGMFVGGRFFAGGTADRYGAGRFIRISLLVAAVGLLLMAPSPDHAEWGLLVGAGLYGFAFGFIQTDTLLLSYRACGSNGGATASLWWNASVDGATGIGAAAFSAIAASSGFPMAFVMSAFLVAVGVLLPIGRAATVAPQVDSR